MGNTALYRGSDGNWKYKDGRSTAIKTVPSGAFRISVAGNRVGCFGNNNTFPLFLIEGGYIAVTEVEKNVGGAVYADLAEFSNATISFTRQNTAITDSNGNEAIINNDGQLQVVLDGAVDAGNTTRVLLGAGESFIGIAKNTLNFAIVFVTIKTDVISGIDGLVIEFSTDGENDWDDSDVYTIGVNEINKLKLFSFQPGKLFYRINYKNGANPQTYFDFQTIVKKTNSLPSSHRIKDDISEQDDATLQKSVLTGKVLKTGIFKNVLVSETGELTVLTREKIFDFYENKFGINTDVDTGSVPETIWDGSVIYTYTTVAQNYYISSSSALDTNNITIELLVVDGGHLTREFVTITLQGQTSVEVIPTSTLLAWRSNRAFNDNGVVNVGDVYIYENTAIVGGVPTDITKAKSIIQASYQQTEQAVYTVPSKLEDGTLIDRGNLIKWNCEVVKKTAVSAEVGIYVRKENKIFRNLRLSLISDSLKGGYVWGTQAPEKIPVKSDIEAQVGVVTANDASISAGFQLELKEA